MVNIERKKLRQVLDALEENEVSSRDYAFVPAYEGAKQRRTQAITAIKAALAQPAQEPVAWMEMVVANLVREGVNKHKARELAQHFYNPPQRPWVELTDEEANNAIIAYWGEMKGAPLQAHRIHIRAIEAKLKDKNT